MLYVGLCGRVCVRAQAWGRSRLPVGERGWTNSFEVDSRGGGDSALPLAHTCFFRVDFPSYTNYETLRKRLHTAMMWSGVIED